MERWRLLSGSTTSNLQSYQNQCACITTRNTKHVWIHDRTIPSPVVCASAHLHTKFEVSVYICYEDMKGGAKCRKWSGLGRLGVTQGHRRCHHSVERIRLPIPFLIETVGLEWRLLIKNVQWIRNKITQPFSSYIKQYSTIQMQTHKTTWTNNYRYTMPMILMNTSTHVEYLYKIWLHLHVYIFCSFRLTRICKFYT